MRIRLAFALIGLPLLLSPILALAAFDHDLRHEDRGTAVVELQQFLIARGHLAAGNATGYFGPLTLAAVRAFQAAEVVQPTSGFFGPLTRAQANVRAGSSAGAPPSSNSSQAAQIALLLERIRQLQTQISALQSVSAAPSASSDLVPGPNCAIWSDGCNTCSNGGGCTELACAVKETPRCLSYTANAQCTYSNAPTCPSGKVVSYLEIATSCGIPTCVDAATPLTVQDIKVMHRSILGCWPLDRYVAVWHAKSSSGEWTRARVQLDMEDLRHRGITETCSAATSEM